MQTRLPRRVVAAALALALLPFALPPASAQDVKPDNCYPTALSGYAEYSLQNVQRVWDMYAADTRGVCRWDKSMGLPMPQCRYGVQLGSGTFGWTGTLCFWGTRPAGLTTNMGGAAVASVLQQLMDIPGIQDALGPGTHVILLVVGGEEARVTMQNGVVIDIDGKLLQPPGCYQTYLPAYREYNDPNVRRVWDGYSADSLGVCRIDPPDRPELADCKYKVEYGSPTIGILPFWLCWWGSAFKVQQADASAPVDAVIKMSEDTLHDIMNSDDPLKTALQHYKDGHITVTFEEPVRRAGGRVAGAFIDLEGGPYVPQDPAAPAPWTCEDGVVTIRLYCEGGQTEFFEWVSGHGGLLGFGPTDPPPPPPLKISVDLGGKGSILGGLGGLDYPPGVLTDTPPDLQDEATKTNGGQNPLFQPPSQGGPEESVLDDIDFDIGDAALRSVGLAPPPQTCPFKPWEPWAPLRAWDLGSDAAGCKKERDGADEFFDGLFGLGGGYREGEAPPEYRWMRQTRGRGP